jgi:hypothetical protein
MIRKGGSLLFLIRHRSDSGKHPIHYENLRKSNPILTIFKSIIFIFIKKT